MPPLLNSAGTCTYMYTFLPTDRYIYLIIIIQSFKNKLSYNMYEPWSILLKYGRLLIWGNKNRQIHRWRKQNRSSQGLQEGIAWCLQSYYLTSWRWTVVIHTIVNGVLTSETPKNGLNSNLYPLCICYHIFYIKKIIQKIMIKARAGQMFPR